MEEKYEGSLFTKYRAPSWLNRIKHNSFNVGLVGPTHNKMFINNT